MPNPSVDNQTREASENCLKTMIRTCLDDEELIASQKETTLVTWSLEQLRARLISLEFNSNPISLPSLLEVLKDLVETKMRFRPALDSASQMRKSPLGHSLLRPSLQTLVKMRDLAEVDKFEFGKEVERTIGAIINACGIEWTLSKEGGGVEMSLGLSADAPERAWLLALFQHYGGENERFGHFKEFWMQKCQKVFDLVAECEKSDGHAIAKGRTNSQNRAELKATLELVLDQIFGIFPRYCTLPVDLEEELSNDFLNTLGNILYSRPTTRPAIINGLGLLVKSFAPFRNKSTTRQDDLSLSLQRQTGWTVERVLELFKKDGVLGSKRAISVLGVLANLYGRMPPGSGYVLDCVEIWLGNMDEEDLKNMYTRINGILVPELDQSFDATSSKSTQPMAHSMLDFMIALASVSTQRLAVQILNQTSALLEKRSGSPEKTMLSQDAVVEKKLYRILVKLVEKNGMLIKVKVAEDPTWMEKIITDGETVSLSAKKDRVIFLLRLVDALPSDSLHLLVSLIPEAILGTKDANEVGREASYELLIKMGRKMGETGGTVKKSLVQGMAGVAIEEVPASIEEYITMVSAGLAGTSAHSISATITSLSRLLFEFHASLPPTALENLLSTVLMFLESNNREVVKSTVGFVKVSIVALPSQFTRPHLPALLPRIIRWSHEHKNHLKSNIRHILERLIRKFGFEVVEKFVPEDDKKLLVNIKKRQIRAKRKRTITEDTLDNAGPPRKGERIRTAYEEIVGSTDESDTSDIEMTPAKSSHSGKKVKSLRHDGGIILNDDDEPLDLLDEGLIGKISVRAAEGSRMRQKRAHFKTGEDGRVVIRDDEEQDVEGPTVFDAFLEATEGESGLKKNERGVVKFNKITGKKRGWVEEDDAILSDRIGQMEVSRKKKKSNKEDSNLKKGRHAVQSHQYVTLSQARKELKVVPKKKR
ncbi:hypothetical protein BT69DRAFT_615638 [Atractiella rhizophila]|nr:hypothetical protein BT69DRAFT_615638 [Atractiella rhizophila]